MFSHRTAAVYFLFLSVLGFAKGPYIAARSVVPAPAKPIIKSEFLRVDPAPARLRIAPAIGILSKSIGFGGLMDLTFSTGGPFFLGVESGYIQWNVQESESASAKMTSIPILATFIYRFDLKSGSVHPYLGAALGVSLTRGSIDGNEEDFEAASVETQFELLGRPGVEFDLSKTTSFYIEPQLGMLNSQFIFAPQVGMAFNF